MSHVPTVLKSDRSVFDKMFPVDDNGLVRGRYWRKLTKLNEWNRIEGLKCKQKDQKYTQDYGNWTKSRHFAEAATQGT